MSIEVNNLSKNYGTQKAVDQVSFAAQKGEIVGFLGPNGAGKSTTMKMITGYLKPDGGTALVNGIDVAKDTIGAQKNIGYLPEANPLYYEMYVKEYLGFIAGIHGLSDKNQQVNRTIELTGLTLESKKKVGQLSKGYKQRVGLAAALIHDPQVLILDEPTSGLDPNQIIEIRNVIKQQGASKTVLFSSHILQEIEAICDRVVIINRGKMVANDTLSRLKQSASNNLVKVVFREAVPAGVMNELQGAVSINSADGFSWQIEAADANAVRKQLLELSLRHNLNITSLQTEGGSLEDIFRSLTMAK